VPKIQVLQKRNRNFSPNFDHASQQVGIVEIKRTVKSNGERDGLFRIINFEPGQVRVG